MDIPKVCLTLDLEPDYAGFGSPKYYCWNETKIKKLLCLLQQYSAKLTIFVVAQSLNRHQEVIDMFLEYGAEFHLHSYSHDVNSTDNIAEITLGAQVFRKRFGYPPRGYRATLGFITSSGLHNLTQRNFCFDSSVFPSFWPKLTYFFKPNHPYRDRDSASQLLEIPISTVSPLRFLLTLSWFKLLGYRFYLSLFRLFPLPKILIFNIHLHDLWESPVKKQLPFSWKIRYIHNSGNGMVFLEKFLIYLQSHHYRFSTLNELVANHD